STIELREPRVDIRKPDGTYLPSGVEYSYRQAPGVFGLGLLEAVPDDTLIALADRDDGDGISGRVNMVWDIDTNATVVGRFGHKASQPSLRLQTAGAFANDIGLSNKVFPDPDDQRDVSDDQFDQVVFFVQTLSVPEAGRRDASALRGRDLFHQVGCASCH